LASGASFAKLAPFFCFLTGGRLQLELKRFEGPEAAGFMPDQGADEPGLGESD
jgi:hypothetical protein